MTGGGGEPIDEEVDDGVEGLLAGSDAQADAGADSPPDPHRPRRHAPTPRRRRPGALLLTLLTLVVVLGAVVVGGAVVVNRVFGGGAAAPDYAGAGDGTVARIQVRDGDTAAAIAGTLVRADVVKSAAAFAGAAAGDPRSLGIQPGFYELQHQMSAASALERLLDPMSRVRSRVTIPEGTPLQRTLDLIASETEVPRADLTEAVANPTVLGLPAYAKNQVEGYLFPATYDIPPGTSAVEALRMMTQRFAVAAESVQLEAKAKALGRTPGEIVIVASLIEREAAEAADRPQVAQVVYNRLRRGIKLGFESTLRYALGNATDQRLRQSQIDSAQAQRSPYNTFVVQGLPPGPIANPGQAALEAALNPTGGDILYFVTLPANNKTEFVKTESEFNALVARCQAEGGC